MDVPAPIRAFWSEFLAATGRPADTPLYDVFHFDDHQESADALAALVLRGQKRATATLLWYYEARDKRPPEAGDLSVVTDWQGTPRCVIETTGVHVTPFDQVDAAFAAAEGEGDGSLAHWRDAHWAYFGRVCASLGRAPSLRMPVVCERFRVVFSGPSR